MRITVFGASGRVGRKIVEKALAQNMNVTAFVHSHDPFEANPRLTVVQGDIKDQAAVQKALQGSEGVVSALGSWGTKTKDIVATGMRSIIPTMEEMGIQRLVTLTGAGALLPGEPLSITEKLAHQTMQLFAGKILADGERHLELLSRSSLQWTCVRAPVMSGNGGEAYRLDTKRPGAWATVPREAVVAAVFDLVTGDNWAKQAPFIMKA